MKEVESNCFTVQPSFLVSNFNFAIIKFLYTSSSFYNQKQKIWSIHMRIYFYCCFIYTIIIFCCITKFNFFRVVVVVVMDVQLLIMRFFYPIIWFFFILNNFGFLGSLIVNIASVSRFGPSLQGGGPSKRGKFFFSLKNFHIYVWVSFITTSECRGLRLSFLWKEMPAL